MVVAPRWMISSVVFLCFATGPARAGVKLPAASKMGYPPELPGTVAETYKTVGDVELKLFIYRPADWKPADRRAAIVFFFGGGWNAGSPGQFRYQCEYLASRGMVAVTADYRVASRNQVKPVDCVRDAKSAIRYVRANAKRLGIDARRIAAGGGSAGGHLAACTALIDGLDEEREDAKTSSKPDALVLFNPALMFGDAPGIPLGSDRAGIDPEAISPFHHIRADLPPTLLMFGTADGMFESARQFTDAMRKAGNRCELDAYADLPHGFFNVGRNDNKPFRQTLETADKFLESLGYLKGPPTVATFFE